MFCISKDTELDSKLLAKMLERFKLNVEPKLTKYKNYYDGIQAILQKKYTDPSKPCSRTVINYCKNIADSYAGYLATPSFISYRSNEDITDVMDILKYNDYQTQDAAFLLDALVYGVACELMYMDADAKTRFKLIDPTTCFGVFDNSLTNDLLYFVRIYKASDWDDTDTYLMDVYSDYDIKHYKLSGWYGTPTFIGEEPHYFSQCPANIFYLTDEKSIFDCILTQQDSYNELMSAEIDDYSAFCDAYLMLKGVDAEAEDIAAMKANRVLLVPADADASFITKSANDAQVENIKKDLHSSIYRTAQCPDFSSESFVGGVSSGIAIQYRLTGMETRAGIIEALMKKALLRRVEIISGIASLKLGEELINDVEITFKRNIPEDITSTINVINSLKGTVSDATLLSQLPFITDVNAELEAVQEQKAANMELYGFNAPTGFEEEKNSENLGEDS